MNGQDLQTAFMPYQITSGIAILETLSEHEYEISSARVSSS